MNTKKPDKIPIGFSANIRRNACNRNGIPNFPHCEAATTQIQMTTSMATSQNASQSDHTNFATTSIPKETSSTLYPQSFESGLKPWERYTEAPLPSSYGLSSSAAYATNTFATDENTSPNAPLLGNNQIHFHFPLRSSSSVQNQFSPKWVFDNRIHQGSESAPNNHLNSSVASPTNMMKAERDVISQSKSKILTYSEVVKKSTMNPRTQQPTITTSFQPPTPSRYAKYDNLSHIPTTTTEQFELEEQIINDSNEPITIQTEMQARKKIRTNLQSERHVEEIAKINVGEKPPIQSRVQDEQLTDPSFIQPTIPFSLAVGGHGSTKIIPKVNFKQPTMASCPSMEGHISPLEQLLKSRILALDSQSESIGISNTYSAAAINPNRNELPTVAEQGLQGYTPQTDLPTEPNYSWSDLVQGQPSKNIFVQPPGVPLHNPEANIIYPQQPACMDLSRIMIFESVYNRKLIPSVVMFTPNPPINDINIHPELFPISNPSSYNNVASQLIATPGEHITNVNLEQIRFPGPSFRTIEIEPELLNTNNTRPDTTTGEFPKIKASDTTKFVFPIHNDQLELWSVPLTVDATKHTLGYPKWSPFDGTSGAEASAGPFTAQTGSEAAGPSLYAPQSILCNPCSYVDFDETREMLWQLGQMIAGDSIVNALEYLHRLASREATLPFPISCHCETHRLHLSTVPARYMFDYLLRATHTFYSQHIPLYNVYIQRFEVILDKYPNDVKVCRLQMETYVNREPREFVFH